MFFPPYLGIEYVEGRVSKSTGQFMQFFTTESSKIKFLNLIFLIFWLLIIQAM